MYPFPGILRITLTLLGTFRVKSHMWSIAYLYMGIRGFR